MLVAHVERAVVGRFGDERTEDYFAAFISRPDDAATLPVMKDGRSASFPILRIAQRGEKAFMVIDRGHWRYFTIPERRCKESASDMLEAGVSLNLSA